MTKNLLINQKIDAGERLLKSLDEQAFLITDAFWAFNRDENEWWLFVVTPLLNEIGPAFVYKRIQAVLRQIADEFISLSHLKVVYPNEGPIDYIKKNFSSKEKILLDEDFIHDGMLYSTLYIYRSTHEKYSTESQNISFYKGELPIDKVFFISSYEGKDFFLLASLGIYHSEMKTARKELDALRRKIKDYILNSEEDYLGKRYLSVSSSLPNLDGSKIFHSSGYFRVNKPTSKDYWKKHLDWISEVIDIGIRAGVSIFPVWTPNYSRIVTNGENSELIDLKTPEVNQRYLESIKENIYESIFPIILKELSKNAYYNSQLISIVWDDQSNSRGFRNIDLYNQNFSSQELRKYVKFRFLNSEEEPLLQMADIFTFIIGRHLNSRNGIKPTPFIDKAYTKFVEESIIKLLPGDSEEFEDDLEE